MTIISRITTEAAAAAAVTNRQKAFVSGRGVKMSHCQCLSSGVLLHIRERERETGLQIFICVVNKCVCFFFNYEMHLLWSQRL